SSSPLFPYTTLFRSRGVSFVDDLNRSAGVRALVVQHLFEHAPAGVEQGFSHPGLDQLLAAHITDDDVLIRRDDLGAELMTRIVRSEEHTSELQSLAY